MRNIKSVSSALLFSILAVTQCDSLPAHDYIVIIDTSASMLLPYDEQDGEPRSMIDAVKGEFTTFLNALKPGDTVAVFAFNGTTRFAGREKYEDEQDRAKIAALVDNLNAQGKWTFTKAMLATISKEVGALPTKKRQPVVLIFSDGRDDPPPNAKKQKAALKEIAETPAATSGEDEDNPLFALVKEKTYIYYVSLSKLQNSAIEQAAEAVEGGEVKTIDAQKELKPALADISREIEDNFYNKYIETNPVFWYILYTLCGLLLLALLIWWIKRRAYRVSGQLEFFEKGFSFDKETINLGDFKKTKLTLGKRKENDVRLPAMESDSVLMLSGGGNLLSPFMRIVNIPLSEFKLLPKDKTGRKPEPYTKREFILEPGSKFQLANMIFTYKSEKQPESTPKDSGT